jgi:hypothetical protein
MSEPEEQPPEKESATTGRKQRLVDLRAAVSLVKSGPALSKRRLRDTSGNSALTRVTGR